VQLHRAHEQFAAAGADVVLIGQGKPHHAKWFSEKYAPSLRVLADEQRRSYKALGLKVGSVGDLLGPKSAASGVKHMRRSGVVQGRPIGNVSQLGGALVVRPGGEVALQHRSEHAGDSVEPETLLAAL
jgi:hypothetical protein